MCAGGFFSKLFIGGSPRVATPLTEPLEGGLTPPQEPGPTTAPTTRASALGNGVTVAAENTPVFHPLPPAPLLPLRHISRLLPARGCA